LTPFVYCFKNISLNTTQSSCQDLCFVYFTDWSVYMAFTYDNMARASEKWSDNKGLLVLILLLK